MKHILTFALVFCMVLCGCQTSSPKGGNLAAEDQAFRLVVPGRDVAIKQGEIVTIPFEIKRDKFFRQDVNLQIQGPQEIRIDPQALTIKASTRPIANVRFAAPAQAPIASYRINVTATPQTGKATSAQFLVKVKAQDLR